ncbi:hypothetical protein AAE478_008665 [Parahypoxylon ruwenzoriense]
MSEHPYRYGHYPGQQQRIPFTQSSALPPNTQPPYYGAFQQPNIPAGNYTTLNNSYQYNANAIPGLGLGNPFQPVSYPAESNATRQFQPEAAVVPPREQTNPALEEGELSEGEFEDLYEPKAPLNITGPTPLAPQVPNVVEDRHGSVGDADGSSIYDSGTPQGEVITNSTSTSLPAPEQEYSPGEDWEPSYQDRERSGSYSPYLSPREIQRKVSVTKIAPHGAKQTIPALTLLQSAKGPSSNGVHFPGMSTGAHAAPLSVPPKDQKACPPFHSVPEAKKKAQEAILGLWPLKVRYQDYIEEGFDEKLIKGLFADLGLEASIPKPTVVHKAAGDLQAVAATTSDSPKAVPESQNDKDQHPTTSKPKQPVTAKPAVNTTNASDVKTVEKSAAEERKDKIARKLAAKAQKSAAPAQPSEPTPPRKSAPGPANIATPVAASPLKPKTRAENNAILHQKLAALKKAQEKAEAEKKLAAESLAKPIVPSIVPPSSLATIPSPKSNGGPSTTSATAALPLPESDRRSASTEKSLPRDGGIPGLSLSSQPTQGANRNLKRPVASDFDNYPTYNGTLKRSRTQETLIIDVSDDEDVEMDIGSPIDEPNSSDEIINPPPRQTSLGAFPPLSDPSNGKQRSSPASSTMPTPPVHGAKLDLLHKRIEETKRMIAEAEAKKAAKKTNGPQSPLVQPSETESTALPKTPNTQKEIKKVELERRDRIVSHDLPTIEASLKEKQEKLRQAVSQAAQLELEIQANLEERRRLNAEMEGLEESPEGVSAEPTAAGAAFKLGDVAESQLPDKQRASPGQVADVLMTDGEDQIAHSQSTASEARPSPGSSRLASPANIWNLDTAVQSEDLSLGNGELQVNTRDSDVPPKTTPSAVALVKDDGAGPSTITAAINVQTERQGQTQANISELPSRHAPSLTDDDLHEKHLEPASPVHDTPHPRPENDTPRPLSNREESYSPTGERAVNEVSNETWPPQSVKEPISSPLERQNREAQRGSSHERPLLTSMQDEPEEGLPLEDLLSYHSPLGYFRAYRFHPKYLDEVAGGLKSMTYSSRIDPMRPICPRILSGEQCPDGNACEFQHFESMVLPDAEIITQLGSADMFTGETRNRFIEGLKKVLNELKANKVKDFDRITRAIVKHRQEFLEDKSKVLPLDAGTS